MKQKDLLAVLSDCVVSVFATVAGLSVRLIETALKDNHACERDYSAAIDMKELATGAAALCMPSALARRVASKLTSQAGTELTEEALRDAQGELVNQIVGSAKVKLENTPFHFVMGTPRTYRGTAESFTDTLDLPCVRQIFACECDELTLLVAMRSVDGIPVDGFDGASTDRGADAADKGQRGAEGLDEGVGLFVTECEEFLDVLERALMTLEKEPGDMGCVAEVFRILHTIKGNSKVFGFDKLNVLVHRTEDVVRKVRDGEIQVSGEMIDAFLSSVDTIKELVADIREGRESSLDLEALTLKLASVLGEGAGGGGDEAGVLEIEDDMQEIVDGFVVESQEYLEKLDQDLVELDRTPDNMDLVNSVFRAFHTMKGNSKALGFEKLNTLVHRTEDIIRKARDGEMKLNSAILDVVFKSVDLIKELVNDVKERRKSTQDFGSMTARLKDALEGRVGGEPKEQKLHIDEEMLEIVDGFVVESEEMLAQLDRDMVSLDESPENPDIIGAVFRAFHTLKGNSRALGFGALEELVHSTEDIIRAARDGKTKLRPESIDVVLRSIDLIKLLLDDIKKRVLSTLDLSGIKAELKLAFEEKWDALKALREKASKAEAAAPQQARKTASTTIRVDINKLDDLISTTGELVLNRNRLLNLVQLMEQGAPEVDVGEALNEIFAQTNILVSDLQSSVMSTRMQPIGKVFSKYPRVVRDLARDLNKEIELKISGEETELDNTIIEEIADPLIHLVRNSCDHGVETPDERRAKGKPARGTVALMAYQEGNFVIIEIRDDGKGMDPEVLKEKAVSKGLITEQQAKTMPKGDALLLIFAPGFSTAEKVTAVSGRGVGMDVVKTNIAKLNGIIDLDSEKDKGTTLKIRLPLTMAVTTGLEVEIGDERYLIPQEAIVEIVRVPPKAYSTVVKERTFLFRNQYWNPLVVLKEVLGTRTNGREQGEHAYIVVLGMVEKRMGVLVDNVHQQHEVVLKPLGKYVANFAPPETNGATIMGDGSVELILNPNHLIGLTSEQKAAM